MCLWRLLRIRLHIVITSVRWSRHGHGTLSIERRLRSRWGGYRSIIGVGRCLIWVRSGREPAAIGTERHDRLKRSPTRSTITHTISEQYYQQTHSSKNLDEAMLA